MSGHSLSDRLIHMADVGDMGRKPDPKSTLRIAAARILHLEAANAIAVEALEGILKVRVEGWENIWAGSNRCQAIATEALSRIQKGGEAC